MVSRIATFVTESVTIFFETTVTFLFAPVHNLVPTNWSVRRDKTFSLSLKDLGNIPDRTRRELIIIKTITGSGTTFQSFQRIEIFKSKVLSGNRSVATVANNLTSEIASYSMKMKTFLYMI